MAKAWRMSSWLALALLVALLAAAMERSLAEEEASAPAPEADAPAAAPAADDDGAPAPAPASDEGESSPPSIGAKAKAGLQNMMEGLSAGKAKLECKMLGTCPASDAPASR